MPRNPNLVPTVITDVTGKTTTVHKKPDLPLLSRLRFPSPSMSGIATGLAKRKQVAALVARLDELIDFKYKTNSQNMDRKLSKEASPEFLKELPELLNGDPEIAAGTATLLDKSALNEQRIREVAHFHPILGFDSYWETHAVVYGLRTTDFEYHEDLRQEETEGPCIALMKATCAILKNLEMDVENDQHPVRHMEVWSGHLTLLKDKNLANLILERHEDAERIAEIVVKYQTGDANAVLGILEGAPPAIANGAI